MSKISELINNVLSKAGYDTKSTEFAEVSKAIEALTVDVPEAATKSLNGLINMDEAKSHGALKAHYFAQALDPLTNNIPKYLKDYGVSDEDAAELLKETSTYKRVEATIKKIADLKEKSAGSGSKSEKTELEKRINDLNAELSKSSATMQQALADQKNKFDNEFTEMEINQILAGMPLPGTLEKDIEVSIARQLLNKKLTEKNATIKKVDGKIKLVDKDDEKLFIFEAGKELDLTTLTNVALADAKFLKVSGAGGGTPPKAPTPGQAPKTNAAMDEAIANLEAAKAGFQ